MGWKRAKQGEQVLMRTGFSLGTSLLDRGSITAAGDPPVPANDPCNVQNSSISVGHSPWLEIDPHRLSSLPPQANPGNTTDELMRDRRMGVNQGPESLAGNTPPPKHNQHPSVWKHTARRLAHAILGVGRRVIYLGRVSTNGSCASPGSRCRTIENATSQVKPWRPLTFLDTSRMPLATKHPRRRQLIVEKFYQS